MPASLIMPMTIEDREPLSCDRATLERRRRKGLMMRGRFMTLSRRRIFLESVFACARISKESGSCGGSRGEKFATIDGKSLERGLFLNG